MHDGDDFEEDDAPKPGKIYYTGINPDADRAEYALPMGSPALQDGPIEWEEEQDPAGGSVRWTRRRILGVLGTACAVCGGIGVGTGYLVSVAGAKSGVPQRGYQPERPFRRRTPYQQRRLEWARSLAEGSDVGELLKNHMVFVSIVQVEGPDRALWTGIERLAHAALRGEAEDSRRLGMRILDTTRLYEPPEYLRPVIDELIERGFGIGRNR